MQAGTHEARISGLAKRLVADGLLLQSEAERASELAAQARIPFVRQLLRQGRVSATAIAAVAAREFGLPLFNLGALASAPLPLDLVDAKLIRMHNVLPLMKRGNRLFLALSDPSDARALNDVKFHTGAQVEAIVVEDDKLCQAIDGFLEDREASTDFAKFEDSGLDDIQVEADEQQGDEAAEDGKLDETPIVRFVNKILLDAIKKGASDIHVEPYEKLYRIRFRQDGILREIARPPHAVANRICSRFKIMARLDIAEKRVPQDGRMKVKLSRSRSIDFRVNSLPTLWGEKLVLRILDPSSASLGIDALGFEPEQKQHYLQALQQPQGMILVTGPTGSGKTVSLYTGLGILNTAERNISTAEDPVEINLEGINQVAINPKVGLNFASALRAFLRQDPDVVMVGEIRDLETAEIAVKAAQTGHLVLSTLHTNSAAETLSRLRNMGIPSFNLATSVTLIIAQRLARRLCTHCRRPLTLPRALLLKEGFREAQLDDLQLFAAVGCEHCSDGYKGRVGIHEALPITDAISRIIMDNGNAIQIAERARQEGFSDLRSSALLKVAQGLTSLAEANRLT